MDQRANNLTLRHGSQRTSQTPTPVSTFRAHARLHCRNATPQPSQTPRESLFGRPPTCYAFNKAKPIRRVSSLAEARRSRRNRNQRKFDGP
jgi:hypothetical protein